MANRVVYLGPFNNKKKEELINKSLDYLRDNRGNKFYYLLPNGELLTKYRKNLIEEVEYAFEINLFTFDDIINEVLEDNLTKRIDNPMKDLILKEVLKKLVDEGKLNYYKDFISMNGFIKSIAEIIGEIKRSLVYPEDYLSRCPDDPFYLELGHIYEEYEKTLESLKLSDREGDYFRAIEILKKNSGFLKDLEFIIIDEFYDFRPIEIAILKELTKTDIDIYINIPFDTEVRSSNLEKTLVILKDLGFSTLYIEKENNNLFEDVGSKLFCGEGEMFEGTEEIKLIKAPNPYIELKRIFEEIKRIHKNGTNLDDIGIIVLNNENLDTLFKVVKEEMIPVNIDFTAPLKNVPLVREFLNLIQSKTTKSSKFTLINRIKSNYYPVGRIDTKEGLEYFTRKLNFNDIPGLKALFKDNKSINISSEYVEHLIAAIQNIEIEHSKIPDKALVKNFNEIFLNVLKDYDLNSMILERYSSDCDDYLLYRDLGALKKLKETLLSMDELSQVVDEISLEDYYLTLLNYIDEETIIEKKGNSKGIRILSPINSRGFTHKVLFITGLSKENYPNLLNNNFFLKDDNYKELLSIGLDAKNYYERLSNESLKYSSAIASCKEVLYLSYSESGDDIPSMFLDELLYLFKEEEVKDKLDFIEVDLSYLLKNSIQEITTKKELSNYLLYNYYNENNDLDMDLFKLHNNIFPGKLNTINMKVEPEAFRKEKDFNEYNGKIENEIVIDDIKKSNNKIFSISYLESYSRCPYSFLLKNILQVEEMERDFIEYSPIDIGNVYHEVLRHFYLKYKDSIFRTLRSNMELDIEEFLPYLKTLTNKYSTKSGFDLNLKKDLLIVENTYDLLVEFIKEDFKRLSNPKEVLEPFDFEVEFGKDKLFNIEINGETIGLRGVIDRIDKVMGEDKYYIMDYKSSSYGIRKLKDMEKGISLQLPVYIMSQSNKSVIGALYGIIKNSKIEVSLGILDESKIITKRNSGALDKESWGNLLEDTKANILKIVKNIESGDFSVNPLECSSYCIYKDICRYERIVEVE